MARSARRTYARDAKGRFASGGGAAKGASKGKATVGKAAAAKAQPTKNKAKPRGVEKRLNRSSMVQLDYQRSSLRAPGQRYGSKGQKISEMNPQKAQHMGKRVRQQKQAIANWYNRLSPANQKKAMTAMRRNNVMNG